MYKADIEKQKLIRERLEFVNIITSLNPQFLDARQLKQASEDRWTHPWLYFDSLRNYLLLTCFDLLGQPDVHKDFQSWLKTKSPIAERDSALENAANKESLLESVVSVYDDYLSSHSTTKSFKRFINQVLPSDIRQQLLSSIRIVEVDKNENKEIGSILEDNKKIDFLYSMRNAFTHSLINTGSLAGGIQYSRIRILIDDTPVKFYEPIHSEHKSHIRVDYLVHDWPAVLIRTVEAGLTATVSLPVKWTVLN